MLILINQLEFCAKAQEIASLNSTLLPSLLTSSTRKNLCSTESKGASLCLVISNKSPCRHSLTTSGQAGNCLSQQRLITLEVMARQHLQAVFTTWVLQTSTKPHYSRLAWSLSHMISTRCSQFTGLVESLLSWVWTKQVIVSLWMASRVTLTSQELQELLPLTRTQ